MKIEAYLSEQGVAYEKREHLPAYTAQEVAAEEHVSGNMLAKSVLVAGDGKYALCVLPASYKLDMNKVAREMKVRAVRLADETEMARLFPDAEVGAEPPFGNLYELPTLVDRHLAEDEVIVFQAGTHREALRISYVDFARLTKPTVADLAIHL